MNVKEAIKGMTIHVQCAALAAVWTSHVNGVFVLCDPVFRGGIM
jgi:hypothetical protein